MASPSMVGYYQRAVRRVNGQFLAGFGWGCRPGAGEGAGGRAEIGPEQHRNWAESTVNRQKEAAWFSRSGHSRSRASGPRRRRVRRCMGPAALMEAAWAAGQGGSRGETGRNDLDAATGDPQPHLRFSVVEAERLLIERQADQFAANQGHPKMRIHFRRVAVPGWCGTPWKSPVA